MIIPKDVLKIINILEDAGHEAFIVGGCVRDFLLLNKAKDWDITTSALPKEIKDLFNHTIDTGIDHGTVTVVLNKNNYEITTYRIDGEYADFRRPKEVIFTKDITKDLSRRDFTMNAIAYNPKNLFVDPFNGQEDIKNKLIRGVGEPEVRFNEDALRMMRGVRFVNQLGFELEKKTLEAILANASLIKKISIERVRDEFEKLVKSDYIENIYLLSSTGLLNHFLPEISPKLNKELKKTEIILKNIKDDFNLRFSFLLSHLEESEALSVLKRLKFSNATIKEISLVIRHLNFKVSDDIANTRKMLSKLDPDIFKKLISLRFILARYSKNLVQCKTLDNIYDQVDKIINSNECYSLKTLKINGNDLKNIGATGKDIGEALNFCLNIVLKDQILNQKDFLLDKAKDFLYKKL